MQVVKWGVYTLDLGEGSSLLPSWEARAFLALGSASLDLASASFTLTVVSLALGAASLSLRAASGSLASNRGLTSLPLPLPQPLGLSHQLSQAL